MLDVSGITTVLSDIVVGVRLPVQLDCECYTMALILSSKLVNCVVPTSRKNHGAYFYSPFMPFCHPNIKALKGWISTVVWNFDAAVPLCHILRMQRLNAFLVPSFWCKNLTF